jgi:geranylgeranyl diphosphate synthase type II
VSRTAPEILASASAAVDAYLERLLPSEKSAPEEVHRAMRYSVFAGGKRLRPALAITAAEALGFPAEAALPSAAAVELIHAFSLIHDDLPAMDDDDLRRGRPTNHKVFGEAVAILAGDALSVFAFEALVRGTPDRAAAAELVLELARSSGTAGMIGGQILDLAAERRTPDGRRDPLAEDGGAHSCGVRHARAGRARFGRRRRAATHVRRVARTRVPNRGRRVG